MILHQTEMVMGCIGGDWSLSVAEEDLLVSLIHVLYMYRHGLRV